MKSLKQNIYNRFPIYGKNLLVTVYNLRFFKTHGKRYRTLIKEYEKMFFYTSFKELQKVQETRFLKLIDFKTHGKRYRTLIKEYEKMFFYTSFKELQKVQETRFLKLIDFVQKNNIYYREKLEDVEVRSIADIDKIPKLKKDDLRRDDILSEIDDECYVRYTGGTTGKSLKYYLTKDNYIERQACLDFFRGMYGYKHKDKIAWFSGKEIITDNEVKRNVFWVEDWLNHITYYSTFHMKDTYIDSMIDNLNKSKPEYFSGFPSAIYELTKRWMASNKPVEFKLNAIFVTSEPFFDYQRELVQNFFKCPTPDQYASSEGAPFVYECPSGNLHYDMYSGIFEKKDKNDNESSVLVTSFTTNKMPLIRYDIGDKIVFDTENEQCSCGSNMPLVAKIIGREMSFVYSVERGKIGITNIANAIKYIDGIDNIQLDQQNIEEIEVKVVISKNSSQEQVEKEIDYELKYRLGKKINLKYNFVDNIPCEKNGKYMMIKNTLTDADLEIG